MSLSLHHRLSPQALLLGAIGLSFSCSSGGGDGGNKGLPGGTGGDRLRGTVSVLVVDDPDPGGSTENEPNNSIGQANDLGSLGAGESILITGGLADSGDVDVFRITSPSRIEVDLNFIGTASGADLDVLLVDPVGLQPVQRFDTPANSESGSFVIKGTGFLIVQSAGGASDYSLELTGRSFGSSVQEVEPNDLVSRGRYLGTFAAGENLTVTGSSSTGNEDFFLLAFPGEALTFFSLASNSGDLDLHFYDATTTLNPTSSFASSIAEPPPFLEETSVLTSAMTLVAVEVRPFQQVSTDWTLQISVGSPRLAGGPGESTPLNGDVQIASLSRAARGSLSELRGLCKGEFPATMPTEMVYRTFPRHVVVEAEGPSAFETARSSATAMERVEQAIAPMGGRVAAQIPDGPTKVIFDLPAGLSEQEAERYNLALCASLSGQAGIAYAEPDYVAQPSAVQVTPNDPFYNLQWHYEQIQLPAAWGVTTGSNAVRVAVLDTGTTPSSDLQPREVPGFDMISDPGIAGDGDGFDNDPLDVGDSNGVQPSSFHGSHVAGTIGAATNNGYGVAGVTWNAQIMHVRVLGIGGGSTFDITNAILYAAGLPNSSGQVAERCHVQNLSLGGGGFSQSAQNAINDATAAGSLIIAAAGNENSSTPSFPAAYDNVVSVAAVDFNRQRAPYSNFHPTVDIAAPGGDVSANLNGDDFADGVLSTKPDDSVSPTNFENFAFFQGTSMAAPHVAGVAALVLSENISLTPGEVAAILQGTATDLGAAGRDNLYGEGLVNAFAAVSQAGGGGAAPSLSLDAGVVLFESPAGTSRVNISNVGGGLLTVTGVGATTNSGGGWLSAATFGTGQSGSTNVSGVELTVNAIGLQDGEYTGQVQLESNGGNANLQVNLSLGDGSGTIPSYEVFVLAVDVNVDPPETRAQYVLNTTGSLDYALRDLEAGEYVIVAGTDEDEDGFICDDGEPLCGLYPSLGLATRVTLGASGTISGLNFPLQDPNLTAASGAPSSGFRLLSRLEAPEN